MPFSTEAYFYGNIFPSVFACSAIPFFVLRTSPLKMLEMHLLNTSNNSCER